MSAWTDPSWMSLALAVGAGLIVCELDLLLTSAVLHRGMAHRALAYAPSLERAVCVWAWLTEFARPLTWIAAHRHHHAHADTPGDPHAPGLKGRWRVTLLTWYYVTDWTGSHRAFAEERYLRDFRDERLLRALDREWATRANVFVQLGLSLLHPVALGFLIGRLVPYMLAIGYMNAAGHTFGTRRFDNLGTDARGRLQIGVALLLAGEPLGHNYHHRFPTSATFRPGRFDPGHWLATRVLRGRPLAPSPSRGIPS